MIFLVQIIQLGFAISTDRFVCTYISLSADQAVAIRPRHRFREVFSLRRLSSGDRAALHNHWYEYRVQNFILLLRINLLEAFCRLPLMSVFMSVQYLQTSIFNSLLPFVSFIKMFCIIILPIIGGLR